MAWQTLTYAALEVILTLVFVVIVVHIALTGRAEAVSLGILVVALVADIIASILYWGVYWRACSRRRVQDLLREAGLDEQVRKG